MEGIVKWYKREKGYGFVSGEDGEDYFVHMSAIPQGTFIRKDDRISFDPVDTERGKQAQNIQLLQKGSEIRQDAPADEALMEADQEELPIEEAPVEAPVEETPVEETPVEEEKTE